MDRATHEKAMFHCQKLHKAGVQFMQGYIALQDRGLTLVSQDTGLFLIKDTEIVIFPQDNKFYWEY